MCKVKFRYDVSAVLADRYEWFYRCKKTSIKITFYSESRCQLSCDCHHSEALYHLYKNTNHWWIPEAKSLDRPLDNSAKFDIELLPSSSHPQFQIDQITGLTTVSLSKYVSWGEDTLIKLKNTWDLVQRAVSYHGFPTFHQRIQYVTWCNLVLDKTCSNGLWGKFDQRHSNPKLQIWLYCVYAGSRWCFINQNPFHREITTLDTRYSKE